MNCVVATYFSDIEPSTRILRGRKIGGLLDMLLAPSLLDCKHLFVPDYRSVRFNYCLRSGLRGSHCREFPSLRPEIDQVYQWMN
jgi:hypothetical protein